MEKVIADSHETKNNKSHFELANEKRNKISIGFVVSVVLSITAITLLLVLIWKIPTYSQDNFFYHYHSEYNYGHIDAGFHLFFRFIMILVPISGSALLVPTFRETKILTFVNWGVYLLPLVYGIIRMRVVVYYFYTFPLLLGLYPISISLFIQLSLLIDKKSFRAWSAFSIKDYPPTIPRKYLKTRRRNAILFIVFLVFSLPWPIVWTFVPEIAWFFPIFLSPIFFGGIGAIISIIQTFLNLFLIHIGLVCWWVASELIAKRLATKEETQFMSQEKQSQIMETADSFVNEGKKLLVEGRTEDAEKRFEEALKLVTNHQEALNGLTQTQQMTFKSIEEKKHISIRFVVSIGFSVTAITLLLILIWKIPTSYPCSDFFYGCDSLGKYVWINAGFRIFIRIIMFLLPISSCCFLAQTFRETKILTFANWGVYLLPLIYGIIRIRVVVDKVKWLPLLLGLYPLSISLFIQLSLLIDKKSFWGWSAFSKKVYPPTIPKKYLKIRRINATLFIIFLVSSLPWIYFWSFDDLGFFPIFFPIPPYLLEKDWLSRLALFMNIFFGLLCLFCWWIFGELIGRRLATKRAKKKLVLDQIAQKEYDLKTISEKTYTTLDETTEIINNAITKSTIQGEISEEELFIPK